MGAKVDNVNSSSNPGPNCVRAIDRQFCATQCACSSACFLSSCFPASVRLIVDAMVPRPKHGLRASAACPVLGGPQSLCGLAQAIIDRCALRALCLCFPRAPLNRRSSLAPSTTRTGTRHQVSDALLPTVVQPGAKATHYMSSGQDSPHRLAVLPLARVFRKHVTRHEPAAEKEIEKVSNGRSGTALWSTVDQSAPFGLARVQLYYAPAFWEALTHSPHPRLPLPASAVACPQSHEADL